jgi:hypothetical protein
MNKFRASLLAIVAIAAIGFAVPASAPAAAGDTAAVAKKGKGKKKNKKVFTVCKFGCKYKTITKAVDKVKKKNSTIKVKPGTYVEGVILEGKKYNGLTITGTKDNPKKTVIEGENAKSPSGSLAQNGIEGIDVSGITVKNLSVNNFATNGIFFRDSDAADDDKTLDCADYLVKNTYTSGNRAYNVFAFGCVGGRMTQNESTLTGDSAFYVGATPPQGEDGAVTKLDHNVAYLNNQAFSGTNSRYMEIYKNDFFNNGIGLTPNTLDSEPYEPTEGGVIRNNNIFWNNLNYYLPNTPVETISNGLGQLGDTTINFPTGIGIVMFGANGWTVKNNNIFGHFKWGTATFSDAVGNCEGPAGDDCPLGDDATSRNNQYIDNEMGRGGTDTNAFDFFVDGSGSGNCFSGNTSSTFEPVTDGEGNVNQAETDRIYPECPAPSNSGTGTPAGEPSQFGQLAAYVLSDPPETQQCSWTEHAHPPFKDYEPFMVEPGPTCP